METLDALQRRIDEQEEVISRLRRENGHLSQQLALLINRLYRRNTEHIDPSQLCLFDGKPMGPALDDAQEKGDEKPKTRESKKPNRKGHARQKFPAHLPRNPIELTLPENERTCPCCNKALKSLGIEITERGDVIPAQIVVNEYRREKFCCPDGHIVKTPELPPTFVDKSKYEPSVYAHITVSKYADHMPLNRLEGIFKRRGLKLSRSTMWDMLKRVDEIVAVPVLGQMHKELMESSHIRADETPICVLTEGEKKPKTGYMWVYRAGKKILFDFTLSRGRDGPTQFLGEWKGTLQTDGYSGYNEIATRNSLVRAGCWAHVRRKFKEALDIGSKHAAEILRPIQRLFWIESAINKRVSDRGWSHQELLQLRSRVRSQRSVVVLEKIEKLYTNIKSMASTLPKSPLGRAITYIENQWETLCVFRKDPVLEIHNNGCENAIRPLALGRKNWLFVASARGGEVASRLYSLVCSCKALNLDPEAYLVDIIRRISTTSASNIHTLTPWAWAAEQLEALPETPALVPEPVAEPKTVQIP